MQPLAFPFPQVNICDSGKEITCSTAASALGAADDDAMGDAVMVRCASIHAAQEQRQTMGSSHS
jgi:hypothetical protein